MRVALYYPWLYLKSGVERTLLELVTRSRHDWTFITNHYHRDQTYPEFQQLDVGATHEQHRRERDEREPQRDEQQRREVGKADVDDDEVDPPHDCDGEGERDVTGGHGAIVASA